MNRQKLQHLIDVVENNNPLEFDYRVVRKGNCGCAIGTGAELFWGETNDIEQTPVIFDRMQKELELTSAETDILFNFPAEHYVETDKGVVYGFGYDGYENGELTVSEQLPNKEEWVAQARKLMEITE